MLADPEEGDWITPRSLESSKNDQLNKGSKTKPVKSPKRKQFNLEGLESKLNELKVTIMSNNDDK